MGPHYFRQSAGIVSLLLFGLTATSQASLIAVASYELNDAGVRLIEPPTPAPYRWTHSGTVTDSVEKYFYLNTTTLYKYERADIASGSGTLNDGDEGGFVATPSPGYFDGVQLFVVNQGNKRLGDGSSAGNISDAEFNAAPTMTFDFASSSVVNELYFRNPETDPSNPLWHNLSSVDVTIGSTTVTLAADTSINAYDTRFSLAGTSLEGLSTSSVTLSNFVLSDSDANEAFAVSEVQFYAPSSAVPEPSAIALWGMLGAIGGAMGMRRRRRAQKF